MQTRSNRLMRGASRELTESARQLRQTMTPAEARLWERLRGRKLDGLRIRRQHPIGQFVLDFACAPIRLGIELDGPIHDEFRDQDAARDEILGQFGWTMLRFSNDQVLTGIEAVLARIVEVAGSLEPVHWAGEREEPS